MPCRETDKCPSERNTNAFTSRNLQARSAEVFMASENHAEPWHACHELHRPLVLHARLQLAHRTWGLKAHRPRLELGIPKG